MQILGIDPGLARVGYGMVDTNDGEPKMVDCGIISTDSQEKEPNRLLEISNDLQDLIKQWTPELVVVEKFFFYRSSTTISVVQARGVIIMTLAFFQIPIIEFAPMQIKRALTGSGHASKEEVLQAVMRELKLENPPRPDDAADALAIALTGWFQQKIN